MEPAKTMSVNFSDFSTSRILKSLSTSKVWTSPETILVDSKFFADRFRRRRSHFAFSVAFFRQVHRITVRGQSGQFARLPGLIKTQIRISRARKPMLAKVGRPGTTPGYADPHHLVHRGIPPAALEVAI